MLGSMGTATIFSLFPVVVFFVVVLLDAQKDCKGTTLETCATQGKVITPKPLLEGKIINECCIEAPETHAAPELRGNLNPDNIFMDAQGFPIVSDFRNATIDGRPRSEKIIKLEELKTKHEDVVASIPWQIDLAVGKAVREVLEKTRAAAKIERKRVDKKHRMEMKQQLGQLQKEKKQAVAKVQEDMRRAVSKIAAERDGLQAQLEAQLLELRELKKKAQKLTDNLRSTQAAAESIRGEMCGKLSSMEGERQKKLAMLEQQYENYKAQLEECILALLDNGIPVPGRVMKQESTPFRWHMARMEQKLGKYLWRMGCRRERVSGSVAPASSALFSPGPIIDPNHREGRERERHGAQSGNMDLEGQEQERHEPERLGEFQTPRALMGQNNMAHRKMEFVVTADAYTISCFPGPFGIDTDPESPNFPHGLEPSPGADITLVPPHEIDNISILPISLSATFTLYVAPQQDVSGKQQQQQQAPRGSNLGPRMDTHQQLERVTLRSENWFVDTERVYWAASILDSSTNVRNFKSVDVAWNYARAGCEWHIYNAARLLFSHESVIKSLILQSGDRKMQLFLCPRGNGERVGSHLGCFLKIFPAEMKATSIVGISAAHSTSLSSSSSHGAQSQHKKLSVGVTHTNNGNGSAHSISTHAPSTFHDATPSVPKAGSLVPLTNVIFTITVGCVVMVHAHEALLVEGLPIGVPLALRIFSLATTLFESKSMLIEVDFNRTKGDPKESYSCQLIILYTQ